MTIAETRSRVGGPVVPAWTYRPGPDVSDAPPPGLVRAQSVARAAIETGFAAIRPGVTEEEIDRAVSFELVHHEVQHVWTITNVGVGANTRICFPTHPPTDLAAAERDVLMIDVHPITPDGSWGDCTRCKIVGDFPEAAGTLRDLEALHREGLALLRPGMPAAELFSQVHGRLVGEGFLLLDRLANIGHSLTAGAAYLHGFIDARNASPMWGAWAIEPFAEREGIAVKVEDVVWFGRERCVLL